MVVGHFVVCYFTHTGKVILHFGLVCTAYHTRAGTFAFGSLYAVCGVLSLEHKDRCLAWWFDPSHAFPLHTHHPTFPTPACAPSLGEHSSWGLPTTAPHTWKHLFYSILPPPHITPSSLPSCICQSMGRPGGGLLLLPGGFCYAAAPSICICNSFGLISL